jgi:hypothetical protein
LACGALDYEEVRRQLADAGFRGSGTRYDETAFGSWLIVIDHKPNLRVVWDGKEGRLSVQREADSGWLDAWIVRTESEQTADAIVRALASL